jgi:hypothetical protein
VLRGSRGHQHHPARYSHERMSKNSGFFYFCLKIFYSYNVINFSFCGDISVIVTLKNVGLVLALNVLITATKESFGFPDIRYLRHDDIKLFSKPIGY